MSRMTPGSTKALHPRFRVRGRCLEHASGPPDAITGTPHAKVVACHGNDKVNNRCCQQNLHHAQAVRSHPACSGDLQTGKRSHLDQQVIKLLEHQLPERHACSGHTVSDTSCVGELKQAHERGLHGLLTLLSRQLVPAMQTECLKRHQRQRPQGCVHFARCGCICSTCCACCSESPSLLSSPK